MTDAQQLFWVGNVAKARIISRIVADRRRSVTVLDYGAGRGGDWPAVLAHRPGIALVCFEPDAAAAADLRIALRGTSARVLSAGEFEAARLAADYIVSFSVFEHVVDRPAYLAQAKRMLAPDGSFHLNYDDGHFRTALDLDEGRDWKLHLIETVRNRAAGLWPRMGRDNLYQSRVLRSEADKLVVEAGFVTVEERYENLRSLKNLAKSVPPDRVQEFTRWWIEVEDRLNERYRSTGEMRMGDDVNLWREMGSRTLVLRHA
jgi:SAM-dependent methyltransferase